MVIKIKLFVVSCVLYRFDRLFFKNFTNIFLLHLSIVAKALTLGIKVLKQRFLNKQSPVQM